MIEQQTGLNHGPIRLLTQLRLFGYNFFSPFNMFYDFDDQIIATRTTADPWTSFNGMFFRAAFYRASVPSPKVLPKKPIFGSFTERISVRTMPKPSPAGVATSGQKSPKFSRSVLTSDSSEHGTVNSATAKPGFGDGKSELPS